MQQRFSKSLFFQILALVGLVGTAHLLLKQLPDRDELGPRVAILRFEPADWTADVAPLRLAGAWLLTSEDPRIGGVSALAIDTGQFVAMTDSGVVLRFARPSAARAEVLVTELPDGPGQRDFKEDRDSEALAADPLGRGWWVAFETRNQLWLYDPGFTHALGRVAFGEERWPINRGIEGMVAGGDGVLAFPEAGDSIVRWNGRSAKDLPLERPRGPISDAARLPDGRLAVLHRQVTPLGFANAITLLDPIPEGGYRTARSFRLRGTGSTMSKRLQPNACPTAGPGCG